MRSQNIQTPNLTLRKFMQKCLKLSFINLLKLSLNEMNLTELDQPAILNVKIGLALDNI
jgi:hypothetical protein